MLPCCCSMLADGLLKPLLPAASLPGLPLSVACAAAAGLCGGGLSRPCSSRLIVAGLRSRWPNDSDASPAMAAGGTPYSTSIKIAELHYGDKSTRVLAAAAMSAITR
jgi:hypothetical protein